MNCRNVEQGCEHPKHHHNAEGCRTVMVWGPPSPDNASAHIEHQGRNWGRCDCTAYWDGS